MAGGRLALRHAQAWASACDQDAPRRLGEKSVLSGPGRRLPDPIRSPEGREPMKLSFFLPLDLRILLVRYATATGLKLFILWLYGERLATLVLGILPNPIELITRFSWMLQFVASLGSRGGIGLATLW